MCVSSIFTPFGNFLDLCIVLLGLFFDPSRDLAAHSCWTETCCKLLKLSYFYALNYGWWEHTATLCIHYSYRVIYWYCSSLTPTLRLGRDKLRSESPPSKKELAVIWEDWVGVTCECSAPRLVLPDRSIVQQTRSNAKKKNILRMAGIRENALRCTRWWCAELGWCSLQRGTYMWMEAKHSSTAELGRNATLPQRA
jgi:hypothetical protein